MEQELIDDLYGSMVLEHSKNPRNFGTLSCGCNAKGKNPSCGDELNLFLDKENNLIKDIKFVGQGCALSVASTSLMTQAIKNKTIKYTQELSNEFINFIINNKNLSDDYEPLHIFSGVKKFPLRVKCVLLPWRTLQSLIENNQLTVSTE